MVITFEKLPEAIGRLFDRLDTIEHLITHSQTGKDKEEDSILSIKEAGKLINLTVPTIYGLVSRSEIPCSKKGKRLYFSKQELTDWIKSGRKKTFSESQAIAVNYINNKSQQDGKN